MNWVPPPGRVLIIAAHCDDEIIGCAGAALIHQRRRDPIQTLVVCGGKPQRRDESRRAARILKIPSPIFWNVPDLSVSTQRRLPLRLARLIARIRPDIVYRPSDRDAHPDHRALARATRQALRMTKRTVLDCQCEVWPTTPPNALLNMTRDFSLKQRALSVFQSQQPGLDVPLMARRLNASRGLLAKNALYAEGYTISPKRFLNRSSS